MDSCVSGFHVYQDVWTPIIVEVLACRRETTNIEERYAIAVNKMEEVVRHVPCKMLFLCAAFILLDHIYNHVKNFVWITRRINILVMEVQEKNKWKKMFTTAHRFAKSTKIFFHR